MTNIILVDLECGQSPSSPTRKNKNQWSGQKYLIAATKTMDCVFAGICGSGLFLLRIHRRPRADHDFHGLHHCFCTYTSSPFYSGHIHRKSTFADFRDVSHHTDIICDIVAHGTAIGRGIHSSGNPLDDLLCVCLRRVLSFTSYGCALHQDGVGYACHVT